MDQRGYRRQPQASVSTLSRPAAFHWHWRACSASSAAPRTLFSGSRAPVRFLLLAAARTEGTTGARLWLATRCFDSLFWRQKASMLVRVAVNRVTPHPRQHAHKAMTDSSFIHPANKEPALRKISTWAAKRGAVSKRRYECQPSAAAATSGFRRRVQWSRYSYSGVASTLAAGFTEPSLTYWRCSLCVSAPAGTTMDKFECMLLQD